ncbi:MAG TPA: lipocalin family protein [Myxococcota bacterium]|nr:lipocalin family protein [Myxococcota bacterium]HRY93625.1 lipocalin family protein [Myxococcota bacterium]HSA21809.1 lipocalin family protein [Myxococcota bacterium]
MRHPFSIRRALASILRSVAAAISPGSGQGERAGAEAAPARSDARVVLPRDDGAHQARIEWWYWTGHLRTGAERWFGFELVFFEVRLLGTTLQVTHHALTDVQDSSFHFRIERGLKAEQPPARAIDLSHAGLWARGADGRDSLHGQVDDYQLELALAARKAPVLQHDRGYIDYPFGGSTHYYSRERMDARGGLRIAGQELPVTGSAWFDHQWGDMGNVFEQSWDWFGIQLDDDREIMAFRMRVHGEEKLRGGSYTAADGHTLRLGPEEVSITPVGSWRSPHSGCAYPRQWSLRIKDQDLLLTPVLEDQELWSSLPRYWEGAAVVSGAATGRAFIELNSYGR